MLKANVASLEAETAKLKQSQIDLKDSERRD